MTEAVILDTGPLGRLAHPRPNLEIVAWLRKILNSGARVILPDIADYELRRNFILEGLTESLHRLDQLKNVLLYMPLSTETMLKAAEFWATARKFGKPTAEPRLLSKCLI